MFADWKYGIGEGQELRRCDDGRRQQELGQDVDELWQERWRHPVGERHGETGSLQE